MITRNLSRRAFLKMAGTATGGVVLAACAPAATSAPGAAPAASSGPTAVPSPVTLTTGNQFWSGPGFESIGAEFRKRMDAAGLDWLKVDYQLTDTTTLETRMAAGDAPDLIYVYPELVIPWAARKQLVSLTSGINADAVWKKDADVFIKSMNDAYTLKGELYALCMAAEAECTSFNPDIFKAKGVKTPTEVGKDAFTLEKFAEMNAAISDDKVHGYFAAMEMNQGLGDIASAYGGQYFSDDGRKAMFNTPEFISAVDYNDKMVKAGHALNGIQSAKDGQWVAAALSNGLVGTIIAGDWAWGWAHKSQLEAKVFDPEMFYVPSGPNGRKPIAHSAGMSIFHATKHMDAALTFMKFGFTKEFQEVNAVMYEVVPQFPARIDAAGSIFERKLLPDFFSTLFEGSIPSPATPTMNPYAAFGYMNDMWSALFNGTDKRSVKEVMDEMNARVQKDMDAGAESIS